eukprot:6205185-Pleurochrysis_carterae.AAC.2
MNIYWFRHALGRVTDNNESVGTCYLHANEEPRTESASVACAQYNRLGPCTITGIFALLLARIKASPGRLRTFKVLRQGEPHAFDYRRVCVLFARLLVGLQPINQVFTALPTTTSKKTFVCLVNAILRAQRHAESPAIARDTG